MYLPFASPTLGSDSGSSQKIIVVAGLNIRLRLNPTCVLPDWCKHVLSA